MKNIKQFSVVKEQQNLTFYQIDHFAIQCKFINVPDFLVVEMHTDQYVESIQININDYYNKKKNRTRNAAASVQCSGQSNIPQQPQISVNYFYNRTEAAVPLMQLPQTLSTYHPANTPGLIQVATTFSQPQNILIPSAGSTGGPATPDRSSFHYTEVYPDPRTYDSHSSATINSSSVYPNWQSTQPNL
ncbi:unnamed protein product [Rotaria socialis]|uniref:Uncharacterized protein n=1 Tax=Rotaria socialis TaxID=392032 RepID=A0A820DEI8_9BILA|nr:unnamed protein product [Rotaria socialis]